MSHYRNNKSQKFRFAPEVEAAFIIAPVLLVFCILGLFMDHDYAIIPYIIRFILLIIVGYLGATRLHNRWGITAKRNIYNQMVPTGRLAGFYSAAAAWGITLVFMIIGALVDMDMEMGVIAGFLSALLDIGAGFLFGSLGGWIYSKMNRPRIMR